MYKAKRVEALADHRLSIEFEDGVSGVVDLRERLFGPVFEPLRDPLFFRQVGIDEFGAICWPNGADLAPDAIYARVVAGSISESSRSGESVSTSR